VGMLLDIQFRRNKTKLQHCIVDINSCMRACKPFPLMQLS